MRPPPYIIYRVLASSHASILFGLTMYKWHVTGPNGHVASRTSGSTRDTVLRSLMRTIIEIY